MRRRRESKSVDESCPTWQWPQTSPVFRSSYRLCDSRQSAPHGSEFVDRCPAHHRANEIAILEHPAGSLALDHSTSERSFHRRVARVSLRGTGHIICLGRKGPPHRGADRAGPAVGFRPGRHRRPPLGRDRPPSPLPRRRRFLARSHQSGPSRPGAWHFVSIGLDHADYIPERDCTEAGPADCLLPRIESFTAILRDKSRSLAVRLEALKFVVHLVGDLHQPLHCADNMDRGGNDVEVRWFGKRTNLHAVWDSSIIERAGETPDVFAGELINTINRLSPARIAAIQAGTTSDWVIASHALAKARAYRLPRNRRLGQSLYDANVDTIDDQLMDGGLRLARILNDSLR